MRIDQLLKDNYRAADDAKVTVTLAMTLGELRAAGDIFGQEVDIVSSQLDGTTTQAKPAKVSKARKATAKPKSTAAAKKTPTAKVKPATPEAKPTPTAKKSSAGRVKQEEVVAAISAGHKTPADIAKSIKGDQRQVSKALSRYTKAGIIKREGPGIYGLAASA